MFEFLFILALLAAMGLAWASFQARKAARELRESASRELGELNHEHDKHVERLQRKLSEAGELGHLDFVADLLPVLDALDGALKAGHSAKASEEGSAGELSVDPAKSTADAPGLREGLTLVARELEKILLRHGVERCEPAPGTPFDPACHEAVALVQLDAADENNLSGETRQNEQASGAGQQDSSDPQAGRVVECLRPGFVHPARVLRPAAVSVSSVAKSV